MKNAVHASDMNLEKLRADCENCFGLCCVALYFSAAEGFPMDKEAGTPCQNLGHDFKCAVHDDLGKKGLKGCMTYDCLGAGPKTAQVSFSGVSWKKDPGNASKMHEVYLILRQFHEMLWYLTEALTLNAAHSIYAELYALREETEQYSFEEPDALLSFDIDAHRRKVNGLLQKASELVRAQCKSNVKAKANQRKTLGRGGDFIGADLRKQDLKGADLRGAYLIAADLRGTDLRGADFIGADLRDAKLQDADLSECIFLTQRQINAAKGNLNTKLPPYLIYPQNWE